MVAAAAEAVGAPDLPDVEADLQPVGEAVEIARDVARRRVILAAEAVRRAPSSSACPCERGPSDKHAHMRRIAQAVRAAAVADDVVVEDRRRRSSPAPWRSSRAPCRRRAPAPRPTAPRRRSCRGICASRAPAPLRSPRRCPNRRRSRPARPTVDVHEVAHPAVDVALDDDDVVRPLGPALDRDHVADPGRRWKRGRR